MEPTPIRPPENVLSAGARRLHRPGPAARATLSAVALVLALTPAGQRTATAQCPFDFIAAEDAAESDELGAAVAVSGDTAIFGAIGSGSAPTNGAVYVFVRDADGDWSQQARLVAADADGPPSDFGRAVGIDEDVIVVGAGTVLSRGAAYVFTRTDRVWTQVATLTPDDDLTSDTAIFGASVAIDDGTIVVGAPLDFQVIDDVTYPSVGAAYVFERTDGMWLDTASVLKLGSTDLAGSSQFQFGHSVDVDGDRIVVGADRLETSTGAAYVFEKGRGWIATVDPDATLTADDGAPGDFFGQDVAISGPTVIVGAHGDDNANGTNKGAAYVYEQDVAGWTQVATLISANTSVSAGDFGFAVDLVGDVAIVAEPPVQHLDPGTGLIVRGAAHVYREIDDSWTLDHEMIPVDPTVIERPWGVDALAFDGSALAVGSPGHDADFLNSGAGFVFDGLDEDCNDNGVADACDIHAGTSSDEDGDGVPDECIDETVPGDLDGDGDVDTGDLLTVLAAWGGCDADCPPACTGDLDEDCAVGVSDLLILLSNWS